MTLILIEKDPLVALDLAQIVASLLPNAQITHYRDLAEGESQLSASDPAECLVYRTSSDREDALASLAIARRLARSVIAISDSLKHGDWSAGGVFFVPQPFTELRLKDALLNWISS